MTGQEIASVIRIHAENIHIDPYDMGEREVERLEHSKNQFMELATAFEEYSK